MFLPWRHGRYLKADPLVQRHLTAEPSNRMLMSFSDCFNNRLKIKALFEQTRAFGLGLSRLCRQTPLSRLSRLFPLWVLGFVTPLVSTAFK
jgi:hypothetical protein